MLHYYYISSSHCFTGRGTWLHRRLGRTTGW